MTLDVSVVILMKAARMSREAIGLAGGMHPEKHHPLEVRDHGPAADGLNVMDRS